MSLWMYFWAVWLLVASIAFAGITLVVAVRGFQDLRAMFTGLKPKD